MNGKVIARMMNFDVVVKIPGKKNALGESTYVTHDIRGYIKESLVVVIDSLGKEITSSMQVYVEGKDGVQIPANALLSIGHYEQEKIAEGEEEKEPLRKFIPMYMDRAIIKREIYYKPLGVADLGVFYLP